MARILLDTTSTTSSPSNNKSPVAEPPLPNSAESDFVVILAALLCALICVVGLISVVRCAWLRGRNGTGRFGTHPSANRGLKKKVVQSLPKYVFDSSSIDVEKAAGGGGGASDSTSTSDSDCVICLTEYTDGDEIRVLPQCGHRFHVQCIDTWLGSHSSCPSCRQILVAPCQKCGEIPTVSGVCPQLPPPIGVPFKARRLDYGLPSSSSSNSSTFLP